MRIVVNGQQAFGKAVLDALVARGEEVVAVYCAPDARPDRPDPLKAAAGEHGLPVFQPKSFRDQAVHEKFAALKPDLCVMAYVTKIVPSSFLDLPTLGTIQYHPSLLPLHRGPSSINWPIIQGRTETGLTIFWPDDGLDTGPVLLQKKTAIGPDDTLGSIYFDRLFPMGVDAMLEAVDLVRNGKAPKLVQDEAEATYESWCTAEDAGIDWSRPASEIYNLIRGCNPQPGAWTVRNGAKLQIFDAHLAEAPAGAEHGTVLSAGEDGAVIAAGRGAVCAIRVRPEGAGKIAAAEAGLEPGEVLGG